MYVVCCTTWEGQLTGAMCSPTDPSSPPQNLVTFGGGLVIAFINGWKVCLPASLCVASSSAFAQLVACTGHCCGQLQFSDCMCVPGSTRTAVNRFLLPCHPCCPADDTGCAGLPAPSHGVGSHPHQSDDPVGIQGGLFRSAGACCAPW